MSRFNYFVCTDFVMNESFWEDLVDREIIDYVFAGNEECKTTGRKHLQLWFHVNRVKSVKFMMKFTGSRHIEGMLGSLKQNDSYCSKEHDIAFEFGKKPDQGRRTDLESIRKQIEDGINVNTICTESFGKWCIYRRAFDEYASIIEEKRNWETEVELLIGPTGVGKTRTAMEDGAVPLEVCGKYISGYDGEDTVLFDDIDENSFPNRSLLLRMLDRYPMQIRMLGRFRNWKPRKIYITSNLTLKELGWDKWPAIRRRIQIIRDFYPKCTNDGM